MVTGFFFLGSQITADGDCSHESKRCLLLGRNALTNLDSVLKSRDITFLTQVCIVKAMVSLVVMYRYESWTIKKAECQQTDAFELWHWTAISNQSVLKEINSAYSLEGLMLKLQYFGQLMQKANSLEKTHQRRD